MKISISQLRTGSFFRSVAPGSQFNRQWTIREPQPSSTAQSQPYCSLFTNSKTITFSSKSLVFILRGSKRKLPQALGKPIPFHHVFIRLASNTTAEAAAATATTTTTTTTTTTATLSKPEVKDSEFTEQLVTAVDLNENFEPSVEELLNAPERIGYLKSIGLDWGWGPTSLMEYLMEHLHVYIGCPWWVTITLTAILVRVFLFRPYIVSAENGTRMAIVNPIAKPIIDKMMAAQKAGDQTAFFQYKQEQSMIYQRAGIQMWKSGIPLIQMVIGFGTFRLLNGMAKLPVPGMETGGTLWFPNLSVADPYYILPFGTAITLHWVLRRGGETGIQTMNPKMLSILKWGFPFLSMIFTSWLPAGVQLSFFVSGLLSLAQASLLHQPWLRSYFQMTPFPKSNVTNSSNSINSYQSSIRMVQNQTLSQAELNQRFQAPYSPKTDGSDKLSTKEKNQDSQPEGRLKQILNGAVSDIKGTVNEVVETGRNLVGQTKQEVQGRLDKAEIRERQSYEKKKKEEELQARTEELRLRRLERKKKRRQVS